MKKCKLQDIANISTGYPFDGDLYASEGIKVLRGENIGDGILDFSERKDKRWNQFFSKANQYALKEDDIVMQMDGNVGKNKAKLHPFDIPMFIAQRVGCLRAKGNNSQDYLYYVICTKWFQKYIDSVKTGTSIKHINLKQIGDYSFFLHNIENQQKIGYILSRLDEKIQLNTRLNTELEAMAKQLYDYWFVQFDFPDENGKPYKSSGGEMVYNEKLKREIPEGWIVKNVFDIADVLYGFPFSTESFVDYATTRPVVRIRDIQDNTTSAYTTEEVDEAYRLNSGDLVIGMDGNFHMNYWHNNDSFLNQRCVRIRDKKEFPLSIVQLFYNIKPVIDNKQKRIQGSTVGHLLDSDIRDFWILYPSKHRNEIKERFDSILCKLTSNRREIITLTNIRDSLLPMLMNGQVTVE